MINGTTSANTTKRNVGDILTRLEKLALTSFEGRHEGYYISKVKQTVGIPSGEKVEFLPEELIHVEYSYKVDITFQIATGYVNSRLEQYSEQDVFELFTNANLRPLQRWMDTTSRYSLWLLERPPFIFPLLKSPDEVSPLNHFPVPSIAEWETMWSTWDMITMTMISPKLLHEKPIDLRHICLFYLGHVPAFLDIYLSRLLEEPHTEPESFAVGSDLVAILDIR